MLHAVLFWGHNHLYQFSEHKKNPQNAQFSKLSEVVCFLVCCFMMMSPQFGYIYHFSQHIPFQWEYSSLMSLSSRGWVYFFGQPKFQSVGYTIWGGSFVLNTFFFEALLLGQEGIGVSLMMPKLLGPEGIGVSLMMPKSTPINIFFSKSEAQK